MDVGRDGDCGRRLGTVRVAADDPNTGADRRALGEAAQARRKEGGPRDWLGLIAGARSGA